MIRDRSRNCFHCDVHPVVSHDKIYTKYLMDIINLKRNALMYLGYCIKTINNDNTSSLQRV